MMKLKRFSAKTHQGPYLEINEDDHDVDLNNHLFQVLDGFGGSNVGNQAVAEVKKDLKNFYTKISHDPDSTLPFFYSFKYLIEGNALINAIHVAHKNLITQNKEKEFSKRGGVSVVLGSLSENILTVASIGNCYSYLQRKGALIPITKPHNFELLSRDNFKNYQLSLPTNALGLFDDINIEIKEVRLDQGDSILFMSDGCCNRLNNEEILSFFNKTPHDLSEIINSAFTLNNERGNLDNQTALILQF